MFIGNNQGVEAGYGSPDVQVSRSVLYGNNNQVDPDNPVTAGLRFGDSYDGRLRPYEGYITASHLVIHSNGDNVRNYDGSIPGPQDGAIDISNSLTNDADVDGQNGNFAGIPLFGPQMHLLRGSPGFTDGPDGLPLGRIVQPVRFVVGPDFNGDGVVDHRDVDLFCSELRSAIPDMTYDLTRDGVVDEADRDEFILRILGSTYGDANLDGSFDSSDLVQVFAQGEYEDAVDGNSGWADGDWDCDGEFSTSDLVLAFQTGDYQRDAAAQSKSSLTAAAFRRSDPDPGPASPLPSREVDANPSIQHDRPAMLDIQARELLFARMVELERESEAAVEPETLLRLGSSGELL